MKKLEPLIEILTKRELEILALLVENKTNQEIADQLHLALSSVKWYAGEIYGKLGVENRRQAVKKTADLGLLGQPGQEPKQPAFPSGIVTFLFTDIIESRMVFLDILSAYAIRSGSVHQAARILGASDAIFQDRKNLWFPWEMILREETVQSARLALGEEAFRSAWGADQDMAFLQAFDKFLQEIIIPK